MQFARRSRLLDVFRKLIQFARRNRLLDVFRKLIQLFKKNYGTTGPIRGVGFLHPDWPDPQAGLHRSQVGMGDYIKKTDIF